MTRLKHLCAAFALVGLLTNGAGAQLLQADPVLGHVMGQLGSVGAVVGDLPARATETLANARIDRITSLIKANPTRIALDQNGFPARAGEVLIDEPDDALLLTAAQRGFRLIEKGEVLGIGFARMGTPSGQSLSTAIRALKRLGARSVSADQLHTESGIAEAPVTLSSPDKGPAIGIIDSGVAGRVTARRGFASGAPNPGNHGSAIASLITGGGAVRGALPTARLFSADVYGTDPAGGNASAIAKAIGWLVGENVSVLTISLVGPANPLLARVVAAAQARGAIIVAAVGNDGPASPFSYPASYPGVIAVTGIDGRDRVLIEAGRATHLDYAAPGADMLATTATGASVAVRGTSFAAPLVAATIAAAYPALSPSKIHAALARVDAGARKGGNRYGRGIVCEKCRTPVK
ncbi:MAG: peptidase [Sphingomonadales bacterium]|nr:peptidase [Sphingomonadales bacterium]